MVLRDILLPPDDNIEQPSENLQFDLTVLEAIQATRCLRGWPEVAKCGNLHLAWEYAQDPHNHKCFINMLRVSPHVFDFILTLIKDHPVFFNNSHVLQTPVDVQLAITLYHMGRFGNGASLEDIAWTAGCSEGSVEEFTDHCFGAIESLHDMFVRPLTDEKKEKEKEWMDQQLGFKGLWREGYLMYDGTIIVVYAKPGLNGDAYYNHKANYGLNAQVSH